MKLSKLTLLSIAVISGLSLSACSSRDPIEAYAKQQKAIAKAKHTAMQNALAEAPEWYLTPQPSDDMGTYAVALGKSSDMQYSGDLAKLQAEFAIAQKINQVVSGRERMHKAQANGGAKATSDQTIVKTVTAADVVGYRVVNKVIQIHDGQYLTYILIHMPYQAQQKVLDLQDRSFLIEAHQAYDEVEASNREKALNDSQEERG